MSEILYYPQESLNLVALKRPDASGWFAELTQERMREARGWDKSRRTLPGSRSQIGSHRITPFRVYRAIKQLRDFIEFVPEKRGGAPVLRGTRFRLSQLFAQFADGDSIDDLVENLDLDGEMLRKLLHSISIVVEQPPAHERDST